VSAHIKLFFGTRTCAILGNVSDKFYYCSNTSKDTGAQKYTNIIF